MSEKAQRGYVARNDIDVGSSIKPDNYASDDQERGWLTVLGLALLTVVVATIALANQQLTFVRSTSGTPNEGFYLYVAQYQIAHHRLKQELRAIAAGEPANLQELSRRAAVLASKASILTEPSELKSLLGAVPGYGPETQQVADLQRHTAAILQNQPFTQSDAIAVLAEFKAVGDDELLNQLASDVRRAEINAKDEMMRGITRRIIWAWGGFALCWLALGLWLLYAIRSRQMARASARDRQRAVEAMEQAIVAKRRFLSMVNHEVRSPLQNIVASAELLSMKDNRPESTAAIRRIRHAVTALQGQLRDLLTIARSDTGQLPIQEESFELDELVQDVCAEFEDAAHAKGLSFTFEHSPVPVTVVADPIRIAQVLRNLVENAVRYTSTGHIRVRIEPCTSDALTSADLVGEPAPGAKSWICFEVHDTGPGLPLNAKERLTRAAVPFEPRIDDTGIGLFVIRDVLRQLGGRIEVRSRDRTDPDGQGTTFAVWIPVVQAQNTASPSGGNESADSLNVLIVDDLYDVRDALSGVARRLGHSCSAVESADEAHRLLESTRFDVVLIDLQMPGKDGLSLATEIRQRGRPNTASMLILMSAEENRVIGEAWPFHGFLQKPIDGPSLRRLIGSRTLH